MIGLQNVPKGQRWKRPLNVMGRKVPDGIFPGNVPEMSWMEGLPKGPRNVLDGKVMERSQMERSHAEISWMNTSCRRS